MAEKARIPKGSACQVVDLAAAEFAIGAFGDEKKPAGAWSREAGPSGPACHFAFEELPHEDALASFSTSIEAGPAWDEAAGISFLVKGDGAKGCAAIQLADATDDNLLYEFWFSIESTEWRRVTVPWCDFMPVTPRARFLDAKAGAHPSDLGSLRFGKYVRRRDRPAYSFSVAEVRLEPEIAVDGTDYTPATGGTPRLLAKLRAGEPVSMVVLGDSLTDPRHAANNDISWTPLLAGKMKDVFGGEVSVVNAAMGGARLTEALTQSAWWLPVIPEPDLITIWFGPNERYEKVTPEHFRENLRFAADHLRRITGGRSEILLFTCFRLRDEPEAMAELAQVVREVAAETRTGLADIHAAFTEWTARPDLVPWLYSWDGHVAAMGHVVVAKAAWEAITASV